MRKRLRIIVSSLLTLCLAIAGLSAINSATTTKSLVVSPVASMADANSAVVVKNANGTLDVSRDPAKGIEVVTGGNVVSIALPNAKSASQATRLSNGVVTYPDNGDSSNTVIPTSGGVQMLTTIKSAAAPTQYAYPMGLPRSGRVELAHDGGAIVEDATGKLLLTVAAPWAIDANGAKVPTHFEVDGHALRQIVNHTSSRYVYPIVADPHFTWNWWGVEVRYSKWETNTIGMGAGAAAAYFGWTGAPGLVAWAAAPAAAWATRNGYCLSARFYYYQWPSPSFGYYRC